MKDYYKILGIPEDASLDVIEKGFTTSLLNAKAEGKAWFEKYNVREVNAREAYEVLVNPESRSAYDIERNKVMYAKMEKDKQYLKSIHMPLIIKKCRLCGGPLPKWWDNIFYLGKNAHRKKCHRCGKCLTGKGDFWGKCSACWDEIRREKEGRKEERRVAREERDRLREYERRQMRNQKMDDYKKLRKEIEAMPQYEKWRQGILLKFGRQCSDCGFTENIEVDHHPKSFYAIIQKYGITNTAQAHRCVALWNLNNGRPLCKSCHNKTLSSIYHRWYEIIDEYEKGA